MRTYPFNQEKKDANTFPEDGFGYMNKQFKYYEGVKTESVIEFDLKILKEYFPEKDREQLIALCDSVILSIVSFRKHEKEI